MGHQFGACPTTIGNVQSILINPDGTFKGVADSSRNGAAIGLDLKGNRK
jgi:gamma-glutamyltranspeptidase / glutathione hydrolase